MRRIPVCEPVLGREETEYVSRCLASGWISGIGKDVSEFEERFARFCECDYGIATNSGTTALHLGLATLGVKSTDEVILPTFSMIACANAVSYCTARPVLVDSEKTTWNMDPKLIRGAVNPKTRVIMPVHTYGHPVDMEPVLDVAGETGLHVLEDCSEAHGAEYRSRKVGSLGDMAAFSFYSNKIITTGEGGMLVTKDQQLAERARWLRAHAFGRGGKHFWHEEIGFGYRMSALQASVGLAQLEKIDRFIEKRRSNARLYSEGLSDLAEQGKIGLPIEMPWARSVYWMYTVMIDRGFGITRDELVNKLSAMGVETRTTFYPIHVQPPYAQFYSGESFPIAEEIAAKGINLPSSSNLTRDEVSYVVSCIKQWAQ